MKAKLFSLCALFWALVTSAGAQEFPIGIWLDGNQNAVNDVHSMGFTWVTAYGGWNISDSPNYNHILQNSHGIKVSAILERNIYNPSFAQRLWYNAELTNHQNGLRNYFTTHVSGNPSGSVWQALVANHSAGWMF